MTQHTFNGATAFQRWKREPTWRKPKSNVPSMGPPPFSDGNHYNHGQEAKKWKAFNGATAFQRWKLDTAALDAKIAEYPSMGPPPFSDGNIKKLDSQDKIHWALQWGHRLSAMET